MQINPSRSILDRRALGAIELLDAATKERITAPVQLQSDALGFVQNRSGLHVINSLRAVTNSQKLLAEHLNNFLDAPANLADSALNFNIIISDPKGRYVTRNLTVSLPQGAAVNTIIQVTLYPSASAPIGRNWSGIRGTFTQASSAGPVPLQGARVTLLRDVDSVVLGRGYTDQRGEVLAVAVGIPVIDFTADSNNNTLVGTKKVTTRIEIHTGTGQAWPPDPEAIETSGQAWVPTIGTLPKPELATGQIVTAGMSVLLQHQT
jgi:hypothetical protein